MVIINWQMFSFSNISPQSNMIQQTEQQKGLSSQNLASLNNNIQIQNENLLDIGFPQNNRNRPQLSNAQQQQQLNFSSFSSQPFSNGQQQYQNIQSGSIFSNINPNISNSPIIAQNNPQNNLFQSNVNIIPQNHLFAPISNAQQQQQSNQTFQQNYIGSGSIFQQHQSNPLQTNLNFQQHQQQNSLFNPVNNAYQQQQQNIFQSQQQFQGINQLGFNFGPPSNSLFTQPKSYDFQIFNDDEAILEKVKIQEQKEFKQKIQINIKAQRSVVKLHEETILPAMCSIVTSGGSRSSVDLICVIDVSGSMQGEKIELVKQTMKFLIEILTPEDRLSIITFNNHGVRICPLKCVTEENMISFTKYINELYASGGTTIMSGLNLALKTIQERKIPNKVTSVFLLSDGQDKGAEQQFRSTLKLPINSQLGVFSIHSFGFGTDHDQDLMNKICTQKDGNFYFIKQLATLDQAFCNALGGVISMVANEIVLKINNISQGIVQGIKISRVFGDKWQKINDYEYKVRQTQVMSGISKDYVFEITIPKINTQVGDLNREHKVIEGQFIAKTLNNKELKGSVILRLALFNQNEDILEVNENIDVIQNYLRVKAAEAIEINMKKAENNNFQQAQKGIDVMISAIQSNKKVRKQKVQHLVQDLQLIRQKCCRQEYQNEGRKWMVNAQNAHSNQSNFGYANHVQFNMVEQRKISKQI